MAWSGWSDQPLTAEGERILRAKEQRKAARLEAELARLRERSCDFRLDELEAGLEQIAADEAIRTNAKLVVDRTVAHGVRPSRVEVDEEGITLFYLPSDQTNHPGRRAYATLSVTEDGLLVGLLDDGGSHASSWEQPLSKEAVVAAAERLRSFFIQ